MAVVLSNGDVLPCPAYPKALGNISKKNIPQIWNHSREIALMQDRTMLKGRCGSCSKKNICGGCRSAACAVNGSCNEEDPGCPFTENNRNIQ